jgi:hypothetical protein
MKLVSSIKLIDESLTTYRKDESLSLNIKAILFHKEGHASKFRQLTFNFFFASLRYVSDEGLDKRLSFRFIAPVELYC